MRLLSCKVFLIPSLLVFLISGAFGKAENLDVLADSAKAFYLGGDFPDSRARADSILKADPQNPIANILTGLFRLSEGGLKNRTSAREIIEKYGRHLEDDPFANYALGVLYNAVDNPEQAKKHFLRVVALDEKFVPALVELGMYYLDSMLKYYNRYTDTSIPLSYRDYALEDYDLGVSYLHKALDYDKENKEAAYTLGSLFYEAQEYLAMTVLFRDQLKYHPEDRDLNLFMGLAYLSQFRYSDASQYFRRALKHMSAEDIELFQNPEYLIKDKKKLAEIDSQSTDFWKARDPMFLTAENERLLEHYGRVAYANLRFSVPKLKIEGWRTDRGKTYIRYGKPLYIVEFAKSMEVNAIYPPSQIWVYPQFQLSFSDEFWNGEYRYSEPIAGSNSMFKERSNVDFGLVAQNVFQEIPETFDFSLPGGEFDAPYRFTFFKSGKMAEALVSFAVPVEEALYEPAQELESGLYLMDDNKLPVFEKKESVTVDFQEP
ncbi:MAG: GWxTD domain-containing protein, partial [Calditrichia bacterium]